MVVFADLGQPLYVVQGHQGAQLMKVRPVVDEPKLALAARAERERKTYDQMAPWDEDPLLSGPTSGGTRGTWSSRIDNCDDAAEFLRDQPRDLHARLRQPPTPSGACSSARSATSTADAAIRIQQRAEGRRARGRRLRRRPAELAASPCSTTASALAGRR
jgi:hypothetical protein